MKTNVSRRTFLQSSAQATAFGLAALQTETSGAQITGANNRIRLGFIGVANRGGQLIAAFTKYDDVEVAALCDVDATTLGRVRQQFDGKPFVSNDFRKLYDRKDLDGIVLATPDHWHAIQTIEACKAGKDVYCEKPLCVTVVEGRKMVEAARKYNRIVQVGTNRRSLPHYMELAKQGVDNLIGFVTVGRSFRPSNMFPDGLGKATPSEPPKDLDWDLWLGPRPERPFQATIAPYKFRWWDLYSSQMGNWGVHYLDAMRWLLGEESPISVCAMGGRYVIDDDRTVPDTAEAMFEFKKGRLLTFAQYEACGNPCIATDEKFRPLGEIELRGTNGTLFINNGGWQAFPEYGGQFQQREARMEKKSEQASTRTDGTEFHARNFLDCIKSRQTPNCDVEAGHRSTTMSLLANISLAVRQRLDWDADAEKFVGNDAANQLLHYEYRAPWKLE